MKILRISDSLYGENCYLLIEKENVIIIDPGFSYDQVMPYLTSNKLNLKAIFLTHGHIDHIYDIDRYDKSFKGVPIYIHEKDSNMLYDENLNVFRGFGNPKKYSLNLNVIPVNDGYEIDGFKFIHSPGHTKGSVIIKYQDNLFTGDTLFKGTVGRTDLPTGNIKDLYESLELIRSSFSKSTIIYPGHDNMTTLKDELKYNPYLEKRKR